MLRILPSGLIYSIVDAEGKRYKDAKGNDLVSESYDAALATAAAELPDGAQAFIRSDAVMSCIQCGTRFRVLNRASNPCPKCGTDYAYVKPGPGSGFYVPSPTGVTTDKLAGLAHEVISPTVKMASLEVREQRPSKIEVAEPVPDEPAEPTDPKGDVGAEQK